LLVHEKAHGTKPDFTYLGSSRGQRVREQQHGFGEYIDAQGDTSMRSMVLEGGIKSWVAAGQAYIDPMDGFDEEAWSKEKL
jgi:arsenical-resistance protein 2